MNFLAHLYLAYPDPDLMLGNFIADAVKGNPESRYSGRILDGIRMHRQIDHFTDNHPINKEFNAFLRPQFGKFAGVVSDIFHDHYLAINWPLSSQLDNFASDFYQFAQNRMDELPQKVKYLLPFMIEQNWLLTYNSISGIGKICAQMGNRIQHQNTLHFAQDFLENNYSDVSNFSMLFFPEIESQFKSTKH
ncbi:MAG: ACP phosphodiesterase [Bacteroidia bacterium]|nr:ACP phosphodiesterase [Bacteroidia bacterium]